MELLLNKNNTNKFIAGIIACVAIYALSKIVPQIPSLYQGWSSYFGETSSLYPLIITAITALVPVSIFYICYLVYINNRSLLILIPLMHAVLIFSSYATYGMLLLVLYWWLIKNKQ